MGNSKSLYSKQ
jgi:ankyrin repeat protein